jgi:hypothetical protein
MIYIDPYRFAAAPAPSEPTVYVYDTFTDTGTVNVTDHAGEIGAAWALDPDFGVDPGASGAAFKVTSGYLRRSTSGESVDYSGNEAACSPSGSAALDGVFDYYIEAVVTLDTLANQNLYIYTSNVWGDAPSETGTSAMFTQIGGSNFSNNTRVYGLDSNHENYASTVQTTLTWTAGVAKTLRWTFTGGNCVLEADGATVITAACAPPLGPLWVVMHDSAATGSIQLSSIKIADIGA